MRLLYFNPLVAVPRALALPGMERYSLFSKIGLAGVMTDDRTGTIRTPIQTANIFPMPAFHRFPDTLEDVCNRRAQELLTRMDRLGVKMYLFYSGGIDSTLMLVSILKHATQQQRERLVVLLTEKSIIENPNFFRDHIRGKLAIEVSTMFHYLLGTKGLFVGAELNDLVFGSDFVRPFMMRVGLEKLLAPYERDLVIPHFALRLGNIPDAEREARFFVDLFERIVEKAPMPIVSHFDFFWWVSFSLKWQFISVRMLAFTAPRNAANITAQYAHEYYSHFFDTEEFQLWSMNNLDKRIKDDWKTYKWPCKDIIFDYTKDADYRDNKTKQGSLSWLLVQQDPFIFMDENYGLHRTLAPQEYYEPDNDFK